MHQDSLFQHQLQPEVSSIHTDSPPDPLQPILNKYWSCYVDCLPPQPLQASHPILKMAVLFKEAVGRPYFKQMSRIVEQTNQYYEIGIDYAVLMKALENSDDLGRMLAQIFHGFAIDSLFILSALQIILHWHFDQNGMKSKKVTVAILEYPTMELLDVKAHMVDNFVAVEAIVIKVQQIRLLSLSMEFTCFQCKTAFLHFFTDGVYSSPTKCENKRKQCKSRTFIPGKDKMGTIFVQRIKVQEIDAEGRIPKQMHCQLRESQVGKVITGDNVIIAGVIRTESLEERENKTQGIYTPYMQVNSFKQMRSRQMLEDDFSIIQKMKNDKDIFYSLVKSFCPTIFGHELVKAGLLLGIVGGSDRNIHHEASFRQTSHILLLGDPGIGKSQLLSFAVQTLPHSVYVSATSMSHCGLTVAISKENNEQTLEAGALILADNGICAIDQFDKTSDTSALLEVMEQQTISIAKAGIICQLKCRVGIIASANPIQGCYNKNKSFMENTKISNAILSRFDLIFLMVDKPDPERDKKLSEHIMDMHSRNRKKPLKQATKLFERLAEYESLAEKYSKVSEGCGKSYQLEEVKKYLSFVRSSIHPTLSRGAADILKSFYIMLRDNNPTSSFQITSRQLESLVRLAMARARIECREEVTEEDAYEVTQLMQESLFDSFEEMGYNISALKHETKKGMKVKRNGELSLPKQRTLFVNTLNEMQGDRIGSVWEWGELLKVAKDLDLNIGDFHNFIERLNQDGVLLQKGSKKYSFQGTYV